MYEVASFVRSASIAGLLGCILVPSAFANDDLVFDFSAPRKFAGLGVELWPVTDHQTERDALLHDLHIKFVRVGFTTNLLEEQLKNHMSVAALTAAITKAADDNQTAAYSRLHDEISQLHVGLDLAFWQVPSIWCIGDSDGAVTHNRINPDHIQDYANWIVAHLLYAKRLRLLPKTIEIINEPDTTSSTEFTPEQYDALLFTVRATLDRNGLNAVGIAGPDVGSASTVEAYTQVLERTGHISLLTKLSWHDMDTVKRPEPAGFAGVPMGLLARAHRIPIAITEFSSASPQWDRLPYDSGPKERAENNAADSPDFAVSVAAEALKLIADGADSLYYWHSEDSAFTQDAFGLLKETGERKPMAAALQMFSERIPQNCDVIGPKQQTYALAAVCFRSDHGLMVVTANLSQETRKIDAHILNTQALTKVTLGRKFDSHAPTPQAVPTSTIVLNGSDISFDLPTRTVMVLLMR